jgi:proline iminopeptidase
MRRWMSVAVLVLAGVLVAVGVLGWLGWRMMTAPMYTPGDVRAEEGLDAPLEPPASAESDHFQVTTDVRLHRFDQGQGRPALVLHGGPGFPPSRPWANLEPLGEGWRFVYYHQRGCGRSTRPIIAPPGGFGEVDQVARQVGVATQLADIERIRRLLGEDRLVLIGHSFGGFLAAMYAAEFPEHVAGLVLLAPAPLVVFPTKDPDLFDTVGALLPPEMEADWEDYRGRLFDFRSMVLMDDASLVALNLELVPFYEEAARSRGMWLPPDTGTAEEGGGWAVQGMYLSMGLRRDWSDALATVEAPVLVVHGDRDLQTETASRRYAEWLPNAEVVVVPGAGHMLGDDPAEGIDEAIGAFLAKLE